MFTEPTARWGYRFLRIPLLKELLPLFLTPALLLGFHYRRTLPRLLQHAYVGLLGVTILAFGALCALRARSNIVAPPTWDVQCFWLYGQVAVTGRNFYLPSSLQEVARAQRAAGVPLSDAPDFWREVLNVGFPYPPPTILLTAPLGVLDLRTGALVWYLIQFLALGAAIVLLWRTFFPRAGAIELAFTAAMVLTLRSTYSTIAFGQTNFLMLLLLVLFWRNRERPVGGVYLALGIIVKPVMAFLLLYPVLRRRWRSVAATFAVLIALSLVTIAIFGAGTFATYFTSNPVGRLPSWALVSVMEGSLLGELVRLTARGSGVGAPIAMPAFLVAAAGVTAITCWLIWRLDDRHAEIGLASAVPAALLVYPHSVEYYGVLLLVPILFTWVCRERLGLGVALATACITAEYALVRYDGGRILVFATLLQWVLLIAVGLGTARQRLPELRARPAPAGA